MAHIVTCMLEGDGDKSSIKGHIGKIISPQASTDSLASTNSTPTEEKKSFSWRMYQPAESRKYGLFPAPTTRERALAAPVTTGKQPDSEPVAQPSPERSEKGEKSGGLRLRIKEHNLIRRRKVSVPDLGPMTTVQEVAMDSPTIPGRPPLHERSISSPANTMRQPHLAEFLLPTQEIPHENAELSTSAPTEPSKSRSPTRRNPPLSPKNLTPLVIPTQISGLPRLARQLSLSRLRGASESSVRSVKVDESSWSRDRTPFTPMSASSHSTTPKSAVTTSTLPTPVSAVPTENRESPQPWEKSDSSTPTPFDTPPRSGIDANPTPRAEGEPQLTQSGSLSHGRNPSESASIMERGRPRKKSDGSAVGGGPKRNNSKRGKSTSAEQRAFENLPQGFKPTEAAKALDQNEATYLHKQALGQALRFEVLKKEDVEALSRELRHLDERTEYLRRTYTSLRAGRRNLHSRICQYLRSPRTAKFSHDSMLKQEEALAELDVSIDDWVNKLEHAKNRRTRVRQKLLEHVAAAACMSMSPDVFGVSESLQQAMGLKTDISTPPRSPTKAASFSLQSPSPSPSPHRVGARVPSVIPEVPAEEDAQTTMERMESIRIYADSDVYALLADVESEFTKLNVSPSSTPEPLSDNQQKELHRARSHEVLNGSTDKMHPNSPPAPSPPLKETPATTTAPTTKDGDFFLTSAVFQPSPISA